MDNTGRSVKERSSQDMAKSPLNVTLMEDLPVSTLAGQLESANDSTRALILELELGISGLVAENRRLRAKQALLESDCEGNISEINGEIARLREKYTNLVAKTEANKQRIAQVQTEISSKESLYQNGISEKRKSPAIQQPLAAAESHLREQRNQMKFIIQSLLELETKESSLVGYEWLDKRTTIQQEISELQAEIRETRESRKSLQVKLKNLQQIRQNAYAIYDKWEGRAFSACLRSSDTLEELLEALGKGERNDAVLSIQMKLKKEIEGNEAVRSEIVRERKNHSKLMKGVQRVMGEMKRQTNEVYERAAIEEQRLIQKIITVDESELD
jgi:chromosome segregation ATPase